MTVELPEEIRTVGDRNALLRAVNDILLNGLKLIRNVSIGVDLNGTGLGLKLDWGGLGLDWDWIGLGLVLDGIGLG